MAETEWPGGCAPREGVREGLVVIRHPKKNGQQTAVDEGLGFRTRSGNSVATNRRYDQEM